jgi:hypothetical protein
MNDQYSSSIESVIDIDDLEADSSCSQDDLLGQDGPTSDFIPQNRHNSAASSQVSDSSECDGEGPFGGRAAFF